IAKNISKSVVLVKGSTYSLFFQLSLLLITPNLGVRRNSFFLPKTASNTATVLLTDNPVEQNIRKKNCCAFSRHFSPLHVLLIIIRYPPGPIITYMNIEISGAQDTV